jgi:alpha,alpha-trehalase
MRHEQERLMADVDFSGMEGFIFDMDGVLTSTARLHAVAWKRMFDEYLRGKADRENGPYRPFDMDGDYDRYVDGKPRYDGVRAFLHSRGLDDIPFGNPNDSPDEETICGLGNRKNKAFIGLLKTRGARAFPSTIELIRVLKQRGVRLAAISASKNAKMVLESAEIGDLFDVVVDGVDVAERNMRGKPEPDMFLEAARRIGTPPERSVVVEDALAGVKAGKAGGFALVVGIDRTGRKRELLSRWADIVVDDLSAITAKIRGAAVPISELPSALDSIEEILERLRKGTPGLFLDYDGTLTPIVQDPAAALLPAATKSIIERLSRAWMVAVISGRDLPDIRRMVAIDGIIYAGSHGFDILGANGSFHDDSKGTDFLPSLGRAAEELEKVVSDVDGARVERKRFAVALHYRAVAEKDVPELERRFETVSRKFDDLRRSSGKKVFELRPRTPWDKGKAVLSLMARHHIDDSRLVPVYIGDDTTDEDAFRAIWDAGIGIIVGQGVRKTAARYRLRDTAEVADFLEKLADLAEEREKDDWKLVYEGFDPEREQLHEALCATGNGYFVARGAAPECAAGSYHYPGTYVAGCYNRLRSEVEGHTIENESIVNAPNWLALRFRIEDGEWFHPGTVDLLAYRQELDLREGILTRVVRFTDEKQRRTRFIERRFVHMGNRHLAGLETTITPENWSGRLFIQSAIDGGVDNTLVERYRPLNNRHLAPAGNGVAGDDTIWLRAETTQSRIRIAEAVRTRVLTDGGSRETARRTVRREDYIGQEIEVTVEKGRSVRIEKIAALHTSRDRAISESGLEAAEAVAGAPDFQTLLGEHVTRWKHLWDRCSIRGETDGGRMLQILNLHIFHLLQTVSVHSIDQDSGVPPRGLHGEAYRGLIMWDELFIFPFLDFRIPDLTRALLHYRYRRLERACRAAARAGLAGALFPWQSGSDGREEAQSLHLNPKSMRWIRDNTHLQRHINIAVAYNVWQYFQVTNDHAFMHFYGAEMIVQVARLLASLAAFNPELGRYEIRGVMGPDEFHDAYPGAEKPGIDNNAYTNVMAVWVLCRALEVMRMLPGDRETHLREDLGLDDSELRLWDEISRTMRVPFHGDGIISQFEGYEKLKAFDWERYRKRYGDIERLDRILESEGDSPNRYQVSKQADVLMLFYLLSADEIKDLFERLGYRFDPEAIRRNIEYYMARTSHGSTLSRIVHSWVLSRSNREASWHLFMDALKSDVADIQGGTTHEGIHLGAMAGTVDLIQRCYTGLETRQGLLRLNPALPAALRRLSFDIRYHNHLIRIDTTHELLRVTSMQESVDPVRISCGDDVRELQAGQSLEFDLAPGTNPEPPGYKSR